MRHAKTLVIVALSWSGLVSLADAQTYTLSNTWSMVGTTNNLDTSADNRGLCYFAPSNMVIVNNKGTHTISTYDGTLGTSNGVVNNTGLIAGPNFTLNKIGVSSDGILYGASLTTSIGAGLYNVYQWTDISTPPLVAYESASGDALVSNLSGKRIGDTWAITGGGTNTMILAGIGTLNDFVLLSTTNGTSFTPTVLTVSGLPTPGSGVQFGIAFYTNNSFMVNPDASGGSGNLYLVQFPSNFASLSSPVTATVLATNASLPGDWLDLSYDAAKGLLATHVNAGTNITLFNLPSNNFAGLASLTTSNISFSTSTSINGNETGDIALGGIGLTNAFYTLDTSAGVQATAILFTPALTISLSNTWSMVGATNNLDTSADNRGLCYYAPSNIVIVNNKGTHTISTYDGTLGTSNGAVNSTGLIASPNFTLNKIGVGSDGILYGASLTTSIGPALYNVYQWTNISTPPLVAYESASGDALVSNLSGKRIGDTWAITGGGTNTLILAGIGTLNDFVLLSTANGTSFTPTVLTVNGLPTPGSGVQFGIAFYTNNTFMVNPDASGGSGSLYLVQFPSNFASLSSPVTATVLATNSGVSGNWLDLGYNASKGWLATHGNSAAPITLYSLPANNFFGLASLATTNLSFSTSATINGNETGDIAFGGVNLATAIYSLDTSAGVQATAILAVSGATPPSLTTLPVGGAVYTNIGSFSFSVAATGTQPLVYQWQYNTVSNQATASNIPGATNATFTLSPLNATNTGWYDVVIANAGGITSSIPVLLTVSAPISSPNVSLLWSISPGATGYPYLDSTSYDTRGLAYDTNTSSVLVVDKGADFGIYVLDANTGTNKFTLNTIGVGVSGAQFPMDQIGVADDGVVYVCDLFDTGSTADSFAVFAWPSVSSNAAPRFAYPPGGPGSDPSGAEGEDRWGDTMAVRGAGTNTQILLGTYAGFLGGPATNAALLTTSDGVNFNSTLLTITNVAVPAGFCSLGIAFGASNTFWAKSPGFDLRQISFDPVSGNCSVIQDIPAAANGTAAFASMSAICLDVANNLLAGITFNDVPNDLSVFQLGATNDAPPYMFDQAFFPSNNGNSQDNGATAIKYPRIYSLDVNNGIVALTYSIPLLPFSITSVSDTKAAGVVLTWQSVSNHTYQVQFATALAGTNWTNLGSPIVAKSATSTYDDTSTNASRATGYYRVLGQ